MPKTIVFDRSNFIVDVEAFQQRLNDNAPLWPIISSLPDNELIVVRWRGNWHRAAYKCGRIPNEAYVQLVDSSTTLVHRSTNGRYLPKRKIMDATIAKTPFGRCKGYIFGVKYPFFPNRPFPQTTQEIFNNFFGTPRRVIAVSIEIEQDYDRVRYAYSIDLIADFGDGFQSLRNQLIDSGDGWVEPTYMNKPQNIQHQKLVHRIINRLDFAKSRPGLIPIQNELNMNVERRIASVECSPFIFTIEPNEDVLLHHLIWEQNSDGGFELGKTIGGGTVNILLKFEYFCEYRSIILSHFYNNSLAQYSRQRTTYQKTSSL